MPRYVLRCISKKHLLEVRSKHTMSTEPEKQADAQEQTAQPQQQQQGRPPLAFTPITSPGVALSLIVQFLNIANTRGAFSLQESGKIYEAVQFLTSVSTDETD